MVFPLEYENIYVNGVRLHVVLAGPTDGRPVILLHGFPEFWRGWLAQIEPLAAAGFRVIVPDQRGYNLSDAPAGVKNYSLDVLTGDVLGMMDHFGYQKVCLAGHDWGAAVAWTVASLHPDRVEKLAILNVPHPRVMVSFVTKSISQMRKSWYIGFFQIPWLPDWLLKRDNFASVIGMLKSSGRRGTFSAEDLAEYRKAYANSNGLTGMINWYRAILRYPVAWPTDLRVTVPVRILWGRRDVALSAEMAQESLNLCENGELFYFDTATHWVQHDEAGAINAKLIDYFKS